MRFIAAMAPAIVVLPVMVLAYRSGAGPRMTGGFGEPTCAQCHQGAPPDDRALTLTAPKAYRVGEPYRVRVTLARPGLEVGGFELAARFRSGTAAGRQAGELRAADARTQVVVEEGVQYGQQTEAGSKAHKPGTLSWELVWQPPAQRGGEVVFHVAANASNADTSPLGDRIYTAEAIARPATPRSGRGTTFPRQQD